MEDENLIKEARSRLVEIGGKTSQDLGANRILGQVLIFLYLQEEECPLDYIACELGLSKASVSIAVRQLEQLGLLKQVWIPGDRKNYYRSAENIAGAFQDGLLSVISKKVQLFGNELRMVGELLDKQKTSQLNSELVFLKSRVERAANLQKRLLRFLDNPIVRFFTNT